MNAVIEGVTRAQDSSATPKDATRCFNLLVGCRFGHWINIPALLFICRYFYPLPSCVNFAWNSCASLVSWRHAREMRVSAVQFAGARCSVNRVEGNQPAVYPGILGRRLVVARYGLHARLERLSQLRNLLRWHGFHMAANRRPCITRHPAGCHTVRTASKAH